MAKLKLLPLIAALALAGGTVETASSAAAKPCSAGYVHASLSWGHKCLRAGQFCKLGNREYLRHGFRCPSGRLIRGGGSSRTVPLASRCDPNYAGVCVPRVTSDLDCADIAGTVRVVGVDVHRFDGDGDGYGCD